MAAASNGVGKDEKVHQYVSRLNKSFCHPGWAPECKWSPHADSATNPHTKADWQKYPAKILPSIMKAVGNTPLVRLNRIPKEEGIECDILVKCEFFNPGGSIKDRIGFRMVEDAEKSGVLKPGSTIIEPSSGNTGIGLALAAAVKGYRCIIVMSEKMSDEKVNVLRALGAEIIRTPISADSNSPEGLFAVSYRLHSEIPNSIILDQYSHPGNPLAHYDTTSEEIFSQCDGKVDAIVMGAGTGGTITGIGRKFKEISPKTQIVGVDPEGSILARPEQLNVTDTDFYEVEGLGYDFTPTCMDHKAVDRWIKCKDAESFSMARRLIRSEGLLCGGSSGAAVSAAIKVAKELHAGQKVVVILPDSIRNYLTKFVSDHWMETKGFKLCENTKNHWWWNDTIKNLHLETLISTVPTMTCNEVLQGMKNNGIDQMPIVGKNGGVTAMVTMQKLLSSLISGTVDSDDAIHKVGVQNFPKVTPTTNLGTISRILEKESYVVIATKENASGGPVDKPMAVVTSVDLLHYISRKN